MAEKKHICDGNYRKKKAADMATGAALLGLALGAMVACPSEDEWAQPAYGVPMDDDDSAQVDDDDAVDDDDSGV